MLSRLYRLALLLAVAASASAATDPIRLQLFSGIDREAVEVGGLLQVNLEALAVPETAAAAEALAVAFETWDVGEQLGPAFAVVRRGESLVRWTGDVVEHQRRVVVRVLTAAEEVPVLRLEVPVGSRTWTYETRPAPMWSFATDDAAESAGRSVLSVTAEGTLGDVGFERIGSAFVVGGDALVTAYHVVVGARRVRVRLPSGREVRLGDAWVLDPARDVAILYLAKETLQSEGLQPLVVAPSASGGSTSFTAGWPSGQQRQTVAPRYADLAFGGQRLRVSGNAVRPGDSGGPMLDDAGRVLGVVVSGRGTDGARDLLGETICLASDIGPALRQYQAAEAPVALRRALAAAHEAMPSARAHAAAGAIQIPVRRSAAARGRHISRLREALRQAPDDPILQYVAGTALEDAGEEQLAAFAYASAQRAGYAPAGYSLAYHRLSEGDLVEAAELFRQTAAVGPYRRLGAFGEAKALVELGRYDAAERALLTVLDYDARFAPALYLLGIVRLSQGRDAEARALSVRLATRPEWAAALRLPVEAEAMRPPHLRPLPRLAAR